MSKWKKTCKTAKADSTLVGIARGIVALNREGKYGEARVGHLAFRDRAQEIGISVPNDAYWGFLLMTVAGV